MRRTDERDIQQRHPPCHVTSTAVSAGRRVHVGRRSDHRTVFCSAYCEREFWRHRSRYDRKKNIDTGHVVQAWQLERVID